MDFGSKQSRSQRPQSFWLATGIATSGQVQLRKSAIHGLPVTLRILRVKSDKSDWFWSRSIVFTKPFKTRMSLDLARGPDFSSACQKGPLGTRLGSKELPREKRRGRGRGKKSFSAPPPLPPLLFWLSLAPFSRGQNTENPAPWSFFAPQPHRHACYAG